MESTLRIVVIIIAVCLIVTLLLQAKGSGGGLFGGGATFRTRRGVEKLLFRITIVLGVSFVITTILAVRL